MRALGIRMQSKTKHLGIDYKPGARLARNTAQQERWKTAVAKRSRMRKLGTGGGPLIAATTTAAAARYGVTVSSVPDGLLRTLATIAAEAVGPMRGRSATARLAVRRADPRPAVALRPS